MTWQLDGDAALLKTDVLAGQVELLRPHAGIGQLCIDDRRLAGWWAGASVVDRGNERGPAANFSVEDAYVRGDDLIVVYEPLPTLPFRWQIYWRWLPRATPALAVVDVILSVQTPLLDTRPAFQTGSRVAAAEVELRDLSGQISKPAPSAKGDIQAADNVGVLLLALDDDLCLAEMAPEEDRDDCRFLPLQDGMIQTVWRLGESFMEKGVIRRARMRVGLLRRDGAAQAAQRLYEQLTSQTPPLTA